MKCSVEPLSRESCSIGRAKGKRKRKERKGKERKGKERKGKDSAKKFVAREPES